MPVRRFTEKQEAKIAKEYLGGLSTVDLADKYEVSHHLISSVLNRQGVEIRGPSGRRTRTKGRLDHDEVVRRYVEEGHSTTMIAEADGTTRITILKLLHREEVEMREAGSGNHLRKWKTHGLTSGTKKSGVSPIVLARFRVLLAMGGACIDCGEDDLRVLEVGHKFNKKWKLKLSDLVRYINGDAPELVPQCANCNVRHEYEAGRRRLPDSEVLRAIDYSNGVPHWGDQASR